MEIRDNRPGEVLKGARASFSRVVRGLYDHDAFDRAASISFWLFLSFIPLLLFAGFMLGQIVGSRGAGPLINTAFEVVPAFVEPMLRQELNLMAKQGSVTLAPTFVLGFLWTATGGVHSLMHAVAVTVGAKDRPWWKVRALSLGWVLAGLLLVAAVSVVAAEVVLISHELRNLFQDMWDQWRSEVGHVQAPLARVAGHLTRMKHPAVRWIGWEEFAAAAALLAITTTFLAAFFQYAATSGGEKLRAIHPWRGACTTMVAWITVSWAFGHYVLTLAHYAIYYGSLAAVAVLLMWIYLTSLSLLVGAEVVALGRSGRDVPATSAASPPKMR